NSMLTSSTHDSKRSEDVRARISVLSEMPAAWRLSLRRWRDWNRSRKRMIDDRPAPSRNDEYFVYQTLVGAWPVERLDDFAWQKFVTRIEQYMLKAVREAKEFTSWANPNSEYESALSEFVRAALDRRRRNRFLSDFGEFQRRISRIGMFNSLSQLLLKLTAPGVPDVYQGNELWDFSLVDPDNRRPVDYPRRQQYLQEIIEGQQSSTDRLQLARDLMDHLEDGKVKMYVTWSALRLRRQWPELFQQGGYLPLSVRGARADNVCAFARERAGRVALVAVPRLCAGLLAEKRETPLGSQIWGDTRIELTASIRDFTYENVFTGEKANIEGGGAVALLPMADLLSDFPVGLLI